MFRKTHHLIKILGIEKIQKKYLNYTELTTNNSVENISLSDLPVNSSHSDSSISAFTTINLDKNMNLSISSAKQDKPTNVIRVNKTNKPWETGNAGIKPLNLNQTIL